MELVNITYAGEGVQPQDLNVIDRSLVNSNFINSKFGEANDYLELYIYDENNNLLTVDYDAFDYYPYLTTNPQNNTYSSLTLDPETDVKNRGYNRGNLSVQYNFYKRLFNSQFGRFYWIKEISTSRTELKLTSQTISDLDIRGGFNQYQGYTSTKNYYPIFYLNFGNNQLVVANNVVYTEDEEGSYLVVKLYEALPSDFDIKSQLWIVDRVAESVNFNVNIQVEAENVDQVNRLRGPNFNVTVNNKNGKTTPYYNYNNLLASNVSSSYQKLLSYYQDKSVAINVDYSDFSNFIHFSSAVERVSNFIYKLQLIESKNAEISEQKAISGGTSNSTIVSNTVTAAQTYINNLIEKFDTYEYFLYFESSSWAWPKSNTIQPYSLYSVTSSQVSNFLGTVNTIPTATTQSLLFSASYYDSTNKDLLHNSVPQYLLDDPSNAPYITFLDMIGQHFDNIWLYYKDLSNRYNNTNNPDTGISLDVVSDALRGFGIQLYTNSNVSDNLYYTLFGINPDGSLLPPTGSEMITNYVTSSLATLSAKNIQQEIYKRLYHNLPYLLKTKGTERGVKALISSFGIPDSILTVREFGGTPINSVDGIFDLDSSEYKIAIVTGSNGNVTGSLTLSSSLLSPFTSIQYYQNLNRINTTNIEVGFSPSDTINTNIVSAQGYFNIDQLIGAPGYQYSQSYQPLVSASNAYFSTYTQPHSIWEYIRLIKFYNNSLFKMIKDFVPARANLSTGIIVKSHILERNKYGRHEPIVTFNDYSQSIDTAFISASDGGCIEGSTSWSGTVMTISGSVVVSSTDGIEKYNGELSGSHIVVTNGDAFSQLEVSNLPSSSTYIEYSLGALYQNVTSSVRSLYLLDADYNSDQVKPVNYGVITKSINDSVNDNYNDSRNPNSPYAYVQDYNYFLERSILPRYSGSKTISATYNTYTAGDSSYGKTAAIDKIKYQYAYLIDIYAASPLFPNRSNAQIKYLIDNDENVLDLTKTNKNIFSVQNIYKSGETADVSLFNYDESNPYTQQLVNNPSLQIFEGGFRYLPILHNISGSATTQIYNLSNPIEIIETVGSGGGGIDNPYLQSSNWNVFWWSVEDEVEPGFPGTSDYRFYVSASYIGPSAPPTTYRVNISMTTAFNPPAGDCTEYGSVVNITIPIGATTGVSPYYGAIIAATATGNGDGGSAFAGTHWPPFSVPNCPISITSVAQVGGGGGGDAGGSNTLTYYTSFVTSSQPCLYYISESNQVVFNSELAYYYSKEPTFQSTSDPAWTGSILDPVILPFTLNIGDRISFYDSASRLAWDERFEYTIKNITFTGSGITGSRIYTELDRPVNLALFNSGSGNIDAFSNAPWRSCRYIVWKHIPDETNVMLRYNPKDSSIVENGILFPQYIDPLVRENSGNVIKALKQQNIIDPDTNTIIFQ
jgi:hypothetical protein